MPMAPKRGSEGYAAKGPPERNAGDWSPYADFTKTITKGYGVD